MLINKIRHDTETQFRNFLSSHNHPLHDDINYDDSQFHCFKCPNGCATDARYKIYSNGSGYLKCWKCEIEAKFCANQNIIMPGIKFQTNQLKSNQDYFHNTHQQYKEKAKQAKDIFAMSSEAKAHGHNYLHLKKVKSYGLRVLTHENNMTQDAKCYRGTLLIPCFSTYNNLVSIERIYFSQSENKFEKRPLSGAERTGVFYSIGDITAASLVIVIAEGYTTAATVFEATNYLTFASFNCGNLPHVAVKIRTQHPNAKIIVAVDIDDDRKGELYARKASALVNGKYALPNFSAIQSELRADLKRSDFNDLFVLLMAKGLNRAAALAEVQLQIQKQL